jgi:hypothetical protein
MSIQSFRMIAFLAATLLALGMPRPAVAQVLYGSLTGNITDPSGAAVPAGKVEAIGVSTGISRQATTDQRGAFLIQDLPAGIYKVTISAPAFSSTAVTGIQVVENTVRRLDVKLQVANLGQSITVSAGAEALQTDRADVNLQMSATEIANLPISSTTRSFGSGSI